MENLTKCYCGHTTTCDCVPEQDFKDIELPQQERPETLEEVAERKFQNIGDRLIFEDGAKWQQERSYSEEEVRNMINDYDASQILFNEKYTYNEWFEQFKKK